MGFGIIVVFAATILMACIFYQCATSVRRSRGLLQFSDDHQIKAVTLT